MTAKKKGKGNRDIPSLLDEYGKKKNLYMPGI